MVVPGVVGRVPVARQGAHNRGDQHGVQNPARQQVIQRIGQGVGGVEGVRDAESADRHDQHPLPHEAQHATHQGPRRHNHRGFPGFGFADSGGDVAHLPRRARALLGGSRREGAAQFEVRFEVRGWRGWLRVEVFSAGQWLRRGGGRRGRLLRVGRIWNFGAEFAPQQGRGWQGFGHKRRQHRDGLREARAT